MGLARCTKVQFASFQSHEFITVLVHRKESLQNAPAVKFVKTVYVKIGDLCCMPEFWKKKRFRGPQPVSWVSPVHKDAICQFPV